jgi:hypothetical protein
MPLLVRFGWLLLRRAPLALAGVEFAAAWGPHLVGGGLRLCRLGGPNVWRPVKYG